MNSCESLAANRAAVRLYHYGVEPAPLEYICVRLHHLLVAEIETLFVGVEAVGVLHVELADPQQSSSRTLLVAEFRLNLVQDAGKVAVAVDVRLDDVS